MKTYKTFGIAAAAWAAFVCTVAVTATAAEGDIWSIRRAAGGDHGTETLSMSDNPVTAWQKVNFKFRLLNRDPRGNIEAYATAYGISPNAAHAGPDTWNNMWQMLAKNPASGKVATNLVDMVNATNFPAKVGVWVSGRCQWADIESVDLVPDNWDYTDITCSYTAQPGDFGLLTLAAGTEARPVEAATDGTGAYSYLLKNSRYWGFFDSLTKTNACSLWLTSLQEADVSAYVTFPSDDTPRWVQDRDLSQAGIYIRTIDFDDYTFNDDVWRRIAANGTSSYVNNGNAKRAPALSIPGAVATDHTVTLYAWAADEAVAYMKDGVEYEFADGVTRKVAHITIEPADGEIKEIPGGIYAAGTDGQTTTIFLSATPTNIFRAGVMITNFVTKTVLVGQPEPPSIVVKPGGASDWTAVAGSPAEIVPITVELEGVASYTSDLDVTVTAEMINSSADWKDFIGLSSAAAGDPNGTSATVTIRAGSQSAFVYAYVKRASDDTSASTKGISIKAEITDAAALAYFSGGIIPGTLHVQPSKPKITAPATDTVYYDVPAGEEFEMSFNVDDAVGELSGSYTLEYTLTGIWSTMNTKTLDVGVPSGTDNVLVTNLIFNTTVSNALFRVKNQDGYMSDPIRLTFNVFAKPLIGATPYDHVGTDDNPSRTYNEGDTAKLSFTLGTPFALADAGYIFLVPQTEASSNLVDTTAFEQGIRIVRGQSATERQASLLLLDGAANTELRYEFEIWNTPTKTEAGAVRIGTGTDGYASGEITLYVDNVMPTVEGVSMSATPLYTNGGTMEAKAAKDVTKIFKVKSVNEPSETVDLDDANFLTEWTFYEGGAALFTTNVYGNPYLAEIPYAFHNSGTNKVTVKVKDKDMTVQAFNKSAGFTFFVETLDEPTISMMPYNGSFYFTEEQVGSINGRVDVKLNIAPTAPIEVEITVERDGADDGLTSDPVLNTNRLTFTSGTTSRYFYFKELDGDANFTINAKVITGTPSIDPGKNWDEFYIPEEEDGYPMTVGNSAPMIQGLADTNAVPAGLNVPASPITWAAKDVLPDIREGMTATLSVEGSAPFEIPITTTNAFGTVYGEVRGSYSPTFTSAGLKMVKLVVSDKNGRSEQRIYYYIVEPSKEVFLHPLGPKSRGQSSFSSIYGSAAGRGAGRVWADASANPTITEFDQKWTYDPGVGSANVYGYGYRAGEQATGLLTPGKDFRLDKFGNVTTGSDLYTYPADADPTDQLLDSFFYCWILETKAEDGNWTGAHLGAIQPVVGTNTTETAKQAVGLPEYDDEAVIYDERHVAAIFSMEYFPKDNLGDINQDGVPDVYAANVAWEGSASSSDGSGGAVATDGGGTRLFEVAGYGAVAAGDLKSLTRFNGDEDYLPSKTSAGGSLIPNISSQWATYGEPFTAYLELRGYGDGLNYRASALKDRGRNSAGTWISEKDFTEAESNAWDTVYHLDPNWTPENRTDPTVDDTDGDDLPDGYEYYLWYYSYVGWMEEGKLKRLEGSKFQLEDIAVGKKITPEEIAEAFNPNAYASNVAERDTDNDGLTDLEEFAIGTNPIHWDTDGDGISDYWEIMRGLNPLVVEDDTTTPDWNPDKDYMAWAEVGKNYALLTLPDGRMFAVANNGTGLVDSSGETPTILESGTNTVEAIPVYRYGNASSTLVPIHRGTWTSTSKLAMKSGFVGFQEYTCTSKPLDAALIDWGDDIELSNVVVKLNQKLTLVHEQVRAQYGFDPRTGWGMNVNGCVCNRWDPNMNPPHAQRAGTSGRAVNTKMYSNLDEYLLLKYRYMTSGGSPYLNNLDKNLSGRNLTKDLADWKKDGPGGIGKIFKGGTTNPNKPYSDKTYGDYGSSSDEGSTSLTTFTDKTHGADTDGDAVPDGWELYVGFDPNFKTDGTLEIDGDTMALASEYAGTDSCNAYKDAIRIMDDDDLADSESEDASELIAGATIYNRHPGLRKEGNKERGWFNKFFPTDPWNGDTDGDNIRDDTEGGSWNAAAGLNHTSALRVSPYTFTFIYGSPVDDNTLCIRGGGMNPCSVDTDFDLLPDPWEMCHAGMRVEDGTLTAGSSELDTVCRRNDGNPTGAGSYITAGMDATFGPREDDATFTGDAYTNPRFKDPRTGTVRNFDFDQDGLQNFQEYLVQALRHLRYDDSETPLMGSWMPDGSSSSRTFLGFLPMNYMDGETFYATAKEAGFVGSGAWQFRELGYFARPPHEWDPIACIPRSKSNYGDATGYRIMLPPHGLGGNGRMDSCGYASTDPCKWDSDNDNMDDYYELFHGLNPLLGSIANTEFEGIPNPSCDVIAQAYGYATFFWCNAWTGWPMLPQDWLSSDVAYRDIDAVKYPWMIGTPEADADGDGIRNGEEALVVNMTSPQPTHTDPTPLWLTDSTALNLASYTAQYYMRDEEISSFYPWPWSAGGQSGDGAYKDFLFSFEENEGYDTDGDWVADSDEQKQSVTPISDPLKFTDPDRRQALWFPGENSAAVSRSADYRRLNYAAYDLLRQFTAEAWICPEDVARDQVILERVAVYGASTMSNNLAKVRANFRIGIRADGRLYGLYDTNDAVTSGEGTDTAFVLGDAVTVNEWTHVALSYNGHELVLYMNGRPVNSIATTLIPANGLINFIEDASPNMGNFPVLNNGYSSLPTVVLLGAQALDFAGVAISDKSTWASYGKFYAGYIDEVRVWDGERSASEIMGDMEKRYSFDDVASLRETVFEAWSKGATRNDNDGMPNLPAELLMHFNFQTLPGATDSRYVAWEPSGFTKNVRNLGKVEGNNVPGDIYCGWWYATPVRSTVYKNWRLVPWIQNTVGHLPLMDGSTVDSQFWSEYYGGMTVASELNGGIDKILFPNTANPYPYYTFTLDRYYHEFKLGQMCSQSKLDILSPNVLSYYEFELRTTIIGTSDMVPLGGAFAKRINQMWDEIGPADPWEMTSRDMNANGFPDWWEKIAQEQYGAPAGFGLDTIVTYDGREMTAREAYLRDLMKEGMLPDGSDGVYVYNVTPTYWRTEMVDGFRRYHGELFTDHDHMDDAWEDAYEIGYVNSAIWDAATDGDGDGWSNWSEAAALTDPSTEKTLSLVSSGAKEDQALPAYPIPTVRVKAVYEGSSSAFNGTLVVKAWHGTTPSGVPDAKWTIAGPNSASASCSRFLGLNPNRVVRFNLGPGMIAEQNCSITFFDPHCYHVTRNEVHHYSIDTSHWHGCTDLNWHDDPAVQPKGPTSAAFGYGYVDYRTGDVEIDFTKFQDTEFALIVSKDETAYLDLSRSFVRVNWKSRVVSTGTTREMHLSVADTDTSTRGFLREGKNTFVAFADANGNGEWDVGEPFGVTRGVQVGWDEVSEVAIELTDDIDGMRFALGGKGLQRVRVVRTAINGEPISPRTVWSRNVNLDVRNWFTEADFVKSGTYDFDWAYLCADAARGLGIDNPADIQSATYEVYRISSTNEAVSAYSFTRNFDANHAVPTAISPSESDTYAVYTVRPTFRWSGSDSATAFQIQIATSTNFLPNEIVWDSGTNFLAAGRVYAAPAYVGAELADGSNYWWHVAEYNAQYREATTNSWSAPAKFETRVNTRGRVTGYGDLALDVRYYGPATNDASNVVVAVYSTADFTGLPVARARLAGGVSVSTLTNDLSDVITTADWWTPMTNVAFSGIAPGSYYAMAFIDLDGNGVRDTYEPWGYVAADQSLSHPSPLLVDAAAVTTPSAVIVMEDTDLNGDDVPDCLQNLSWFLAGGAGSESGTDSDHDGLSNAEEEEQGTEAMQWDTDGDGMPDGWETVFAGTDPMTVDNDNFVDSDVMAYAVTNLTVITVRDDVNGTSARYAVMDRGVNVIVSDDVSTLGNLRSIYDYGGKYGLGKATTAVGSVSAVELNAEVVLVHAQVYEFFGFDQTTANPTIMEFDGTNYVWGANTKAFTALDKYLVCRYLEQAYGLANEVAMNMNGTWDAFTLKPADPDNNKDGIPDGWELYVMFGTGGAVATIADARVSPFGAPAYVRDVANTPDGGGLSILQEYDGGNVPSDPWQVTSLKLDGLTDAEAYKYHLKSAETQFADADNDGLSNWAEYQASKLTGLDFNADDSCSVMSNRLDYFYQFVQDGVTKYIGECIDADGYGLIADHDFIEDEWEDAAGSIDVSRFRYDPSLDPDGDGWSNWSEARVGTSPVRTSDLQIDGYQIPAHPVPVLETRLEYGGNQDISTANIVIEARKANASSTSADARWVVRQGSGADDEGGGDSDDDSQELERFIGMHPQRSVRLSLGPGLVQPVTLKLMAKDPNYSEVRWQTKNGNLVYQNGVAHGVDDATWIEVGNDLMEKGDDTMGTILYQGRPVGRIDYSTGEVVIDFTLVNTNFGFGGSTQSTDAQGNVIANGYSTTYFVMNSYFKLVWKPRVPNARVVKFSFSEPESGMLSEGVCDFVAFVDKDGDGAYTVGEPFGFLRGVSVGYDKVPGLVFELRDEADFGARFTIPAQANATTRVRVVRAAINGEELEKPRTVYARTLDLRAGKTFTEADLVKAGEWDFDWAHLAEHAENIAGVAVADINTVTYAVYLDDDSEPSYTFTREFARMGVAPVTCGANADHGYMVSSAQPELRWKASAGYPAFVVQIATDEGFANVVYAATNRMPAATVEGCAFKPDVYVGDGLDDATTYYWRVAQLNSKFTANVWSEVASFHTAVNSTNADTGYGRLSAEVRYFGPADATLADVVVGVYATADFASAPIARMRLVGGDSVSTLTGDPAKSFLDKTVNVNFDGIAPGTYYVMAFIDQNGDGKRDAWESWGYACKIGTDASDRWSPVSFDVSAAKVTPPVALVVMEDTDVNQNWTPDCLEDMSDWKSSSDMQSESADDADGDGIPDEDEGEYGTSVDSWDGDGDGMPDGWEALFAGTDPMTPDGDYAVAGDVMAYVVTNLTVITVWNGDAASGTNRYVVTNQTYYAGGTRIRVGDDAAAISGLVTAYDYGGQVGFGRAATASGRVYTVETNVEVVLVHAQVYEAFGFSPYTANPTVDEANRVNTKPFTALDKYLVCRYLEQAYGLADEEAMNANRTWADYTLKPGDPDNNKDGIPDGWELYVMFGSGATPATLPEATVSPFDTVGGTDPYDYVRDGTNTPDGDGVSIIDEFGSGTDPWNTDTDGDGISDHDAHVYGLAGGTYGGDDDNDGLSNYMEYLISEGFAAHYADLGFKPLSHTNMYSVGQAVPDYFLRVGSLYLGEMFCDHDFMEDHWEDKFINYSPNDVDYYLSRYRYDPWHDLDNDGWGNFAECRAGTDPTRVTTLLLDGELMAQHPTPMIRLRAIHPNYKEAADASVNLVVQAFGEGRTDGSPDAVWHIQQGFKRNLGANTCQMMRFNLGPGSVQPGSVKVYFRDPNTKRYSPDGGVVWLDPDSTEWRQGLVEHFESGQVLSAQLTRGTAGEPVGTVDYETGDVSIDLSQMQDYLFASEGGEYYTFGDADYMPPGTNVWDRLSLANSFIRISWRGKIITDGRVWETVLSEPNVPSEMSNDSNSDTDSETARGYLREGKTMFVVFADKGVGVEHKGRGDGLWTPGEPYGVVTDVDVSWSGTSIDVELTDTSPSMMRIDLYSYNENGTKTFAVANELTDRGANGSFYMNALNSAAYSLGTNDVPSIRTRVRIVRSRINDNLWITTNVASSLDKTFNLNWHPYLTEADLLADGQFDLDWGQLGNDASLTSVTYRVVLGDGSIGSSPQLNNLYPVLFQNAFEPRGRRNQTQAVPVEPKGTVRAGRPTFRWKHNPTDTSGVRIKDYPAFRLRVWSPGDDENPVYDSGLQHAPPRDAEGVYSWTAPIFVDMLTPEGRLFANTNNYTWSVSMLDAKFTEPNDSETHAEFRMEVSPALGMASGYGVIEACVRYYGPSTVSTDLRQRRNLVYVQAFTTPDFTGVPVGETYMTNVADIASTTNVTIANARILGVKAGTYYVRAFIDTDGNHEWSRWDPRGEPFRGESWGYYNYVGTDVPSIYAPRAVTISAGAAPAPVAVFIEDMDGDNDGLPDAWEWKTDTVNHSLDARSSPTGNTFFTKVNPNLLDDLEAYSLLFNASVGMSSQLGLLSSLPPHDARGLQFATLLCPGGAPKGDVSVRIDSFSLANGVSLTVSGDLTPGDYGTLIVSEDAKVDLYLVAAKTPDFAGAKETLVKTGITIKANDETKEVVSAAELKDAIEAAGLSDAAFFKVKLVEQE